jgi:GMP synthase-like glutamine amidotransferase
MNVDEEETYPFLRDETEFLGRALEADVPVLGVCLGAQMIAKAAGARVVPSPEKEIGWGRISLTDAGRKSPIFQELPDSLDVLQWHGDMFEIPERGELLASSTACPHQAFHYGNALGLQFHVEATKEMVALWFQDSPALDDLLRRYAELEDTLSRHAEQLYRNFLSAVT